MDDVEAGKIKDEQIVAVCDMLKALALQSWTQPLRKDETDKNVVQIDRFRNHVWWVGGNALAYRSLLPVAFMYKSIPMIDLIADVSQKCISTTSQNTFSSAFWTEGFTADGAGWGHGKQSLVWGYPIDGTSNALSMLNDLKGSPWNKKLSRENVDALMNFFRGSNWYYFKGFTLPGLDRHNFLFENDRKAIRYVGMLNTLISDWKDSFTAKELTELKQLLREGNNKDINMNLSNDGVYNGTRWFFNNDDLIKKNDKYHIIVNMASVRCDGLESALPGFVGLQKYTGIVYSIVKGFSIYFENKENPLPEIIEQLNTREFVTGTRYVALYLSPFGKWDANERHKAIYYRVKEELLHREIVSQVIEVEKNWLGRQTEVKTDKMQYAVLKNGFNFAFANIAVALLAKLGGTPWSLADGLKNELVIGISAFKSDSLENKYLGSAFSFSGEGGFCGFDCFRSNQMDELAGSILMAVKDYCKEQQALEKLVIHFYKTLSRKELAPIEKGLAELGLDIPVVVVSVNKTFSEDIIGFDDSQTQLMPYSFTYLPINKNQYLLYNNGLQKDTIFDAKEGYPFPMKLSIQYFAPNSTLSIQADEQIIPALFEQICRFSQLYWKSVSRQSLPVTLRYPEMLAQIVPHFARPELPRTGKETLWFL